MSSQKRKRSLPRHLPYDTINPLSHSQGTIKQLRTAGLTADDLLPSSYIPDFPHRPIRPSQEAQDDKSAEEQDGHNDNDHSGTSSSDEAAAQKHSVRKERQRQRFRDAQDKQLGLLTNLILRALDEGDIPRAKRAFGLVRRSQVRGRPVDLRKGALWSLGAEILMRDGETRSRSTVPMEPEAAVAQGAEGDDDGGAAAAAAGRREGKTVRRWGSTANMPRLRAYLESLIRQYPYNRLHPDSISDLDFHPVLFSCEFYDAWAEHRLALERLADESEAWSDGGMDDDVPLPLDIPGYLDGDDGAREGEEADGGPSYRGDHHLLTVRERRLRRAKAELGLKALSAMRDVAVRMDALMENMPYSRSPDLLRLRGMVALYVGDLSVAPQPRTADEEQEGARLRGLEQEKARALFVRMVKSGGQADACVERWLRDGDGSDDDYGADDDDDNLQGSQWGALPVFSSMPMR
jgi:hypothetical protein